MVTLPITTETIFELAQNLERHLAENELNQVISDFEIFFSYTKTLDVSNHLQQLQLNVKNALSQAQLRMLQNHNNAVITESYYLLRVFCVPFLAIHRDWWRAYIFGEQLTADSKAELENYQDLRRTFGDPFEILLNNNTLSARRWAFAKLQSINLLNSNTFFAVRGDDIPPSPWQYQFFKYLQKEYPDLLTIENLARLSTYHRSSGRAFSLIQIIISLIPQSEMLPHIISTMLSLPKCWDKIYVLFSSNLLTTNSISARAILIAIKYCNDFGYGTVEDLNFTLSALNKYKVTFTNKHIGHIPPRVLFAIIYKLRRFSVLSTENLQKIINNVRNAGSLFSLLSQMNVIFYYDMHDFTELENSKDRRFRRKNILVKDILQLFCDKLDFAEDLISFLTPLSSYFTLTNKEIKEILLNAECLKIVGNAFHLLPYEVIRNNWPIFINLSHLDCGGVIAELLAVDDITFPASLKNRTAEETITILQYVNESPHFPVAAYFLAQICSGKIYGLSDEKLKEGKYLPYDEEATIYYYRQCIEAGKEPLARLAKEELSYFLGSIINTAPENEFQEQVAYMLYYESVLADTRYRKGAALFKEQAGQAKPEGLPMRISNESYALSDKTPASPYNRGALVLYRKHPINDGQSQRNEGAEIKQNKKYSV